MPVVAPATADPLVAGASELIGGPPGRHALLGERRFWTPLRWLLLLTLLTAGFGFWQKSPCRTHDWAHEYQYTRGCYSDVLALWYSEQLDNGKTPYLDYPVEYPVMIGGAMQAVAVFTGPLSRLEPHPRVDRARSRLAAAQRAGKQNDVAAARAELASASANVRAHTFYDLTWVLLTVCALVVTWTSARLSGRRRIWDAAMFAVAPGLLLHATTNWDLLATAFAGLGLLAWARKRPVLAGVLLGVGTATKLYPVLFVVPLLALCWRADRIRAGLKTSLALVLTAAVLTGPVYLASPSFAEFGGHQVQVTDSAWQRLGTEGLAALAPHTRAPSPSGHGTVDAVNAVYRFVELNQQRGADWDSLPFLLQNLRDDKRLQRHAFLHGLAKAAAGLVLDDKVPPGGTPDRLNRYVAVGTLLVLALVVLLAVRAPRRPRLAQLLFLTLAGFLLVNKVFSPQYVLWLLPLAVLARPRWGPFLAWQATEVFLLFTRFYYFVSLPQGVGDQSSEGIDIWWFLGAVVLRDALLLVLLATVVRDILRPAHDLVRRPAGLSGDAAGPVDSARADLDVVDWDLARAADPNDSELQDPDLDDPAGGVLAGASDRAGRWPTA